MRPSRSETAVVGAGAAACAACCAGPIIGFLGAITSLGAVAAVTAGAFALVAVALVIIGISVWRRHRRQVACEASVTTPTPVALPTRRR